MTEVTGEQSSDNTEVLAGEKNPADIIEGYSCPIDPQSLLECEACQ